MPSFQYYSTFDESMAILKDLCRQGFRIVAEPGPFDEPRAPVFSDVTDELVELIRIAPSYYLAGDFTRFPVQFFHFDSGPSAGKYAINIQAQGPLLQSIIGRVNVVKGVQTLLPGDTSYQSEYRNPESAQWEKASAETKSAYRKAVASIKKICARFNAGIEIYIAPEALKLFQSGQAQITERGILLPSV